MINLEDDELDEIINVEEEIPDFSELELDAKERRRLKKLEKKERILEEYVNKEKMWVALKDYYEKSDMNPEIGIPLELARMIDDIVTNMSHRPNFSNYVQHSNWMVDMIGDAKVKVFKAVADRAFKHYKCNEVYDDIDELSKIIIDKDDIIRNVGKSIFFWTTKKKKPDISSRHIEDSDEVEIITPVRAIIVDTKKKNLITLNVNGVDLVYVVNSDTRIMHDDNNLKLKELHDGTVVHLYQKVLNNAHVALALILSGNTNPRKYITYKSNPFGFYSQIVWHCFINRIKKEKQDHATLQAYQEDVYENMHSSEAWRNVRRQRIVYDDDGENIVEEVAE